MAHTIIGTIKVHLGTILRIFQDSLFPSYKAKLPASVESIKFQPSTRTNSINLNGKDTIIGDNIIIPMAISTEATTKSIIRNGKNSIKPIWNAVFSSDVINAGIRTAIETSSGLVTSAPDLNKGFQIFDSSLLEHEGFNRALGDIKCLSCRYLFIQIRLNRLLIDLIDHRRHDEEGQNIAIPMMTWFEGVCCKPIA